MSLRRPTVAHRSAVVFAIVALGSLLQGCNRQPQTCLVTGSMQWEGKPIYPASVVFKSESGEPYVGNLTAEGKFFVQVGPPGKYQCSIQVHELGGISKLPATPTRSGSDTEQSELRREDTVPAQFRSANIDIPVKYRSADTSGLSFDVLAPESDLGLIALQK